MTRTHQTPPRSKPGTTVKGAGHREGRAGRSIPLKSGSGATNRVGRLFRVCSPAAVFWFFLVSLVLVMAHAHHRRGRLCADVSIVVKTLVLYTIMITGSIWEKGGVGQVALRRKLLLGRRSFCDCSCWRLHTLYLTIVVRQLWHPRLNACWSRWPPMPPTSSTPRSSCGNCAWPGWGRQDRLCLP